MGSLLRDQVETDPADIDQQLANKLKENAKIFKNKLSTVSRANNILECRSNENNILKFKTSDWLDLIYCPLKTTSECLD